MNWLLDTNIVIFVLKDPVGIAAKKLSATDASQVAVCSIVEAELYYGATRYDSPSKRQAVLDGFLSPFASLPFDSPCVPEYARIRSHLQRRGQIIGGNDLMIAAIALTHDLTLVTHNSDEFHRVPGLRVEDWSV